MEDETMLRAMTVAAGAQPEGQAEVAASPAAETETQVSAETVVETKPAEETTTTVETVIENPPSTNNEPYNYWPDLESKTEGLVKMKRLYSVL